MGSKFHGFNLQIGQIEHQNFESTPIFYIFAF